MIYNKLMLKLNNNEYRFNIHSSYKYRMYYRNCVYKVISGKDFSKLSKTINKIKGVTLKVKDYGELCISIYNKKATDYFYLETQNKEIISLTDYINLKCMTGSTERKNGKAIISDDSINNASLNITLFDNDTIETSIGVKWGLL